jgi:hypothetical protein
VDEQTYIARIEAARSDADELGRIADELQGKSGSAASRLRIQAIALRFKVKKATSAPPQIPWLAELGIQAIDGRALYAYRISDANFARLQANLIERRAALALPDNRALAGKFALWAAEWFRRCYDGTGQRWDALGKVLGVSLEQHEWRRLTDQGMSFWKIPPFKLNGTHHRLAAVARQGGFPVAALDANGWASRFLEALVATLAAMPTTNLDGAVSLTDSFISTVPETWRSRELRVVAGELALEVVRLRRLAEADGVPPGALVSAWLDQNVPDWRDELPLSVGNDAARTLIDGLLKVAPLRGGANAVRCIRWLEVDQDGRRTGVELALSGILREASGKSLADKLSDTWSRLRLYASGPFAQYVSGELAVADPDEDGSWRARPSTSRTSFELDPAIAITAELRGDGRRVGSIFRLAGGESVVGELHVYAKDEDSYQPNRLRLLGTGSGGYRPTELFVDSPDDWTVSPHGPDSFSELHHGDSSCGRNVWRIVGTAIASTTRGDSYLVRAGQSGIARDRLRLESSTARFSLNDSNLTLVRGRPFLRIEEGGRERGAMTGELWWRPAGATDWRPNPSSALNGPCEFAWRDRITGHIRDRRDAVLVPSDLEVEASNVGDWVEIRLSGWPHSASASSGNSHGHNCWRISAKANTRSMLSIKLLGAAGGSFEIQVPLRHQAWIEGWSEGPLRKDAALSLSTINRFVARAERCELLADLMDRNGRMVPQGQTSWWVDGELPLSAIRDDLAALLRPFGDIRARVRLNFNDGHEDYWWVCEFEHDLGEERGGFVATPAIAEDGVRIVRRPLHDAAREEDCGAFSLNDSLQHRPYILPRQQGTALVYLRSGERVLSAPRPVESNIEGHAQNPLGRAMSLVNWHERKIALERLASDTCADPSTTASRQFLRNLIDLALSLDGLPPATFDVLLALCEHPALPPFLLFQARQDEVEPIMRLSEYLPFAWWLIPASHWTKAAEDRFDMLLQLLPDRQLSVAQDVALRAREIGKVEPILLPLLGIQPEVPLLADAVMSFFQRSHDRVDLSVSNPFRPDRAALLPTWKIENEQYWRAFDAPVIAARAARGEVALTPPELIATKDVARRHPRWFREGFVATLKEL